MGFCGQMNASILLLSTGFRFFLSIGSFHFSLFFSVYIECAWCMAFIHNTYNVSTYNMTCVMLIYWHKEHWKMFYGKIHCKETENYAKKRKNYRFDLHKGKPYFKQRFKFKTAWRNSKPFKPTVLPLKKKKAITLLSMLVRGM